MFQQSPWLCCRPSAMSGAGKTAASQSQAQKATKEAESTPKVSVCRLPSIDSRFDWRNIAITLIDPEKGVLSEMAFHEKAGPRQVDFDLSFLKFPFPSWREGVQSGPERSRARSLRRSEPLTARTDLSPFRQEGKGAVALMFRSVLRSCFAPQPKLSPPFHPHSQ